MRGIKNIFKICDHIIAINAQLYIIINHRFHFTEAVYSAAAIEFFLNSNYLMFIRELKNEIKAEI